jgi:hypothetical protein
VGRGWGAGDKGGGRVEDDTTVVVVEVGIAVVPGCRGVGVAVLQAVRIKTRIKKRLDLYDMDSWSSPV